MYHIPVLKKEVIEYLNPLPGQNFIDGTLGGGGHAREIAKSITPNGKVLAIDVDPDALEHFKNQYVNLKNIILVSGNFRDIKKIALENNFNNASGILFDLGVSSYQLDRNAKGFGFDADTLDMRMGEGDLTAYEIVNRWSEQELIELFREYGEESLSKPIAKKIIEYRKLKKIEKPSELVQIISEAYKKYYKKPSLKNPATKVFQALRIRVNDELSALEEALRGARDVLGEGGKIVVISYHSLEDRIVKNFFRKEAKKCICPPEYPKCQCEHEKTLKIITKKLVVPTPQEILENPRSRSAKMRVAEKLKY